jgi:cell volume regulation protein A
MNTAHELILLAGALGLISVCAAAIGSRFNAPLLLVFLGLGMLAGEDGPGRIQFANFGTAYLIGSIALAIILFEGGLKTERQMIRVAIWPSLVLATIGVVLTALIVAVVVVWVFGIPFIDALLIGAVLAPTDAAAVNTVLRASKVVVPERVIATLEVESGLNDPMSVFLTVLIVQFLAAPEAATATHAVVFFLEEMVGGAILGVLAGYGLLLLLRKLPVQSSIYPVLAVTSVLVVFGGAQLIGASGFLAVYLMGLVVGVNRFASQRAVVYAAEAFAWLAQISLFLMLGLLVTPHRVFPLVVPILVITGVLVVLARPIATFASLLPFRYSVPETAFVSWIGLRGAVPIYLTIIPVLAGSRNASLLFGATFGVVIVSLVLQGWSVSPAARLLGFRQTRPDENRSSKSQAPSSKEAPNPKLQGGP